MLKRFYDLKNEIKLFMESKEKCVTQFENEEWLTDLAFLVDNFKFKSVKLVSSMKESTY